MLADALAGRPVAPIPRGYRLRHEPTGVSVAFPRRWQALRGHDARFPGVIDTFAAYNPRLAANVRALAFPGSPLLLLAFDPRTQRGYATNANLLVGSAGGGEGFRAWSRRILNSVRKLSGIQGRVRARRVSLAAGNALRLEFARLTGPAHGRLRLATVQYVVARGDLTYALVYTTLGELRGRYRRLFDQSARSLSLPG
jgi:hypothetical protein